jgi:hypothetical protein
MTPTFPHPDELRALLDALCEETITPEQLRRLEELVLAYPEAEAFYVQRMSLHADLIRHFRALPDRAGPAESEPATAEAQPAPRPTARRWSRVVAVAVGLAGLAAAVIVAIGLWPRNPPIVHKNPEPPGEATDNTVAVLLRTHQAEWDDTGLPTRPGSPMPPGRLVLKSGFAQIEFYNGATVILQGPAEFKLISRTEGYCARGKLRATVPPQAQGFTIGSPKFDLVDRGTEFGLDVGERTHVHVFQGKVDLYAPDADHKQAPRKELTTGQGMSLDGPDAGHAIRPDPDAFLTAAELADRAAKATRERQVEWARARDALRADPALRVYYTFEVNDPWARTLPDLSRGRDKPLDGAIVGCSWGAGRWADKRGLEFKRVSDRVRLTVPGEFASLTLAAWVRPDALPNQNNSLLMADGWEEGAPHWQIGQDGTLILGIKGTPEFQSAQNTKGPQYRAPNAITPDRFGRWVHLAVVYDRDAGQVVHYVDGRPVTEALVQLDLPLRIGAAELGNWNPATFRTKSPVRNFNGCIDEFVLLSRALSGEEVERLYLQGRPPL